MARETQFISDIHREGMLHGTIIRSPVIRGKITSVSIPPVPKGTVVLTAKDIPGSNAVRVLQSTFPLLTQETIQYIGQPIMAVFSPTLEEAQVFAQSISIQFDTIPPAEEQQAIFTDRTVSHGSMDESLEQASRIIEHTYNSLEQKRMFTAPTGAVTAFSDDALIIYASTQWPFHVRGIVNEVCALQKRTVHVRTTAYSPNYGEKLIYPSLYGCLTTLAALKTGKPARLIDKFPVESPRITITRKSFLDEYGTPFAEDIDVSADIGAYPLFADEITEHLRAGVMGYIPLKAYRIRVCTLYSPSPPRYHFDGFNYAAGLFSTEAQMNAICSEFAVNPAQWRMHRYTGKDLKLSNGAVMKTPPLEELINYVVNKSDFHRKHTASKTNQVQRKLHASFTGYLRGIGIASGYAPNGFSRNYPWEKKYSVAVRLDEKNKLTIHTSLCNSGASYTWKKTCNQILGIPEEDIEIAYGDTSDLPNSGPHILSRDISIITPLIQRCCESIKSQRFKEPLPIIVKRGFKSRGHEPSETFHEFRPFDAACWGAVVVELEVDSISYMPEFRGIWCALDCGKIFNEEKLRNNLRGKLLRALHIAVGGRITPEYMPKVDIHFIDRGSSIPLSGTQVLTGLFSAAFISALSQALDRQVAKQPLIPSDILTALEDL